jgi:hypothetical protein
MTEHAWEAMNSRHVCPHGGVHGFSGASCGDHGLFCDMCKSDRADVRAAMQGLLAADSVNIRPLEGYPLEELAQKIVEYAAALREQREKGGTE